MDDNTIARVERGIVLERTTRVRIRGNLFDGVQDGLVVDGAGSSTLVSGNVFLSARRWLIDAAELEAGGNYWGPRDPAAAQRQVRGRVLLQPFLRAQDAGY